MAEEYFGGANWWDSTTTNNRNTNARFDGGGDSGGSSSTTTPANSSGGGAVGYGWLTEASTTETKIDASSLQFMGLGISQPMEWNQQHILRNPEKAENSFRSMLQEGMGLNTTNYQQETSRGMLFGNSNPQQIGRGFSLDQQPQYSPSCSSMESTVTCNQGFQLDSSSSSSVYGSPSSILQGLMGSSEQQNPQNQQQPQLNYGANNDNSPTNFQQNNYFGMDHPQWAKVPQFLRSSSPKQPQPPLQFTNNAPYWNASAPAVSMTDTRPNFFASLQAPPQLSSMPSFEEKPKVSMEARDTSTISKKGVQDSVNKRARNDAATTSTLPPFKVRKEKMGDRITSLQQLVSPFGKTDTASVLSEAIECIKFLHEQISVLSNPYLKSGAPYQQVVPSNEKAKIDPDSPKQDLKSRGLCLVPVSSTFPVTHETTVDFWTPSFGGTFR